MSGRVIERDRFYASSSVVLTAMANASRIAILVALCRDGEISVSGLMEEMSIGQSALSQHLAKLRQAGLVKTRREAQNVFYSVASTTPASILSVLEDLPPRASRLAR
jgi:ArsR family transcriptional regulator, virulence genes transcriptional regulator